MAPDRPQRCCQETFVPILLVALGGAAGAVSRFVLDTFVTERLGGSFPFGTLVINVSGSFAIGLLFALAIERSLLPATIRGPAMIGFIGAYTTFSTLMLETWRLAEDGAVALAVVNLVGWSLLGMLAVVAGLAVGRAWA
jgi:CrcB protein